MEISATERERLAMDIMAIMAETKTDVHGIHATVDRKSGVSNIILKMEIKSLDQLDYLMNRVGRVKDVIEVRRIMS
jgi:GTP pyrophosphokinase